MIKKITAMIFLFLATNLSNAHDSERINALEKEVNELKTLVGFVLLNSQSKADTKETDVSKKPWQVTENWRKLKVGMKPEEVEALLGEPMRVEGGRLTTWYYDVSARVSFHDNQVDRWSEP